MLIRFSPEVAILLDALTFIASAGAIISIAPGPVFVPPRRPAERAPGVLADVAAGARALRGAPAAVRLVAADVLCSGVYGVLTVTLVLLSRKLGAGNSGYGLLLGAYGIGGVLGATVTGRMADPAKWRSTLAQASPFRRRLSSNLPN